MSRTTDMTWAETATTGDYLAKYDDDDLDAVSDPGSRCGRDDRTLDAIRSTLRGRGLRLVADDVGLRAVEVAS